MEERAAGGKRAESAGRLRWNRNIRDGKAEERTGKDRKQGGKQDGKQAEGAGRAGNRREADEKRGQVAMTSQHTGQEGLEGREGPSTRGGKQGLGIGRIYAAWSVGRCNVELEAMQRGA